MHRYSAKSNLTFTAILFLAFIPSLPQAAAQTDATRENDLLYRLQQATVTNVTDENAACKLTIEGHVLSTSGQPMPDAVVCLLEDSMLRNRGNAGALRLLPDSLPERLPGVYARVKTDAKGRYSFRDINAPSFGQASATGWSGYIVAAHPTNGIGWSSVPFKRDRLRSEDIAVHLMKFADISGVYKGTDDKPMADAQLSLYAIEEALGRQENPLSPRVRLFLSASQLMPICRTNAKGEYKFRNLPAGFAAIILAPPSDLYAASLVAISTDPALKQQTRNGRGLMSFEPQELLGTNQTFVAIPVVRIRGEVKDDEGQPVSDVLVEKKYYGSTRTDSTGKFELRLPPDGTTAVMTTAQHRVPAHEIELTPNSSTGLLPRNEYIGINSNNQIMIKPDEFVDSIEIRLTKGVRVIGKVEDIDGKPIKDVEVKELPVFYPVRKAGDPEPPPRPPQQRPLPSAVTGEDGTFELFLTPDVHTLHLSCRSPGLDLPETTRRSINREQEQKKLPHIVVDAQKGQPIALQPVRVKRVLPVEVTVLLPNGQPAAGAEVVIWEHREEQLIEALDDPNNKEISSHFFTDDQGKAQLLSVGKPSVRATVKATLTRDGVALEGESLIASGPGKRTVVQLSPYRQGIQIIPK